jgi:multidrug efflux pump subunit AcrA (membrane-fusion protein)
MNLHLKNKKVSLNGITKKIVPWYKEQSTLKKIIVAVVFAVVLGFIFKIAFGGTSTEETATVTKRKVTVASVSSLSNNEKDFPLLGTVTSVSEATIRSETGGQLTRVYKKLGDTVLAGGVIAEFENSAERAALLSAEGAYDQAKASRNIASLNSNQAGSSLGDTKTQALNAISNAYISMDDAVRGKTDAAFTDPKFDQVRLHILVPDVGLSSSLETKRKSIEKILIQREAINRTLTETGDLTGELATVLGEAQVIKTYLDDLYTAYSKALPDNTYNQAALDGGRANTQVARQAISGTISSLTGAKTALTAGVTATKLAGTVDAQSSGALATADAQVKQALGAYNAAQSRLEKTIIRSPITGTLNSLSISTGDYIGAFTQVGVVSNNGALEVLAFVTEDDAKRITVGSPATVNGTVDGVVTRIASAIDPVSKKIEVRIGIKKASPLLINGQSVSILITKNKKEVTAVKNTQIVIPLSSLKLTPRGANVFTLTSSSTLVAIPVKEGAILGDQIQILEGLTGSEEIVIDARGLKEGQVVTINDGVGTTTE